MSHHGVSRIKPQDYAIKINGNPKDPRNKQHGVEQGSFIGTPFANATYTPPSNAAQFSAIG